MIALTGDQSAVVLEAEKSYSVLNVRSPDPPKTLAVRHPGFALATKGPQGIHKYLTGI